MELLERIRKADLTEITTIHKLLIHLGINKAQAFRLKDNDQEAYKALKLACDNIIANIYDLVIERPRQSQQYITLAKVQEELYNKIFAEENDKSFIVPKIEIRQQTSETNLKIDIK